MVLEHWLSGKTGYFPDGEGLFGISSGIMAIFPDGRMDWGRLSGFLIIFPDDKGICLLCPENNQYSRREYAAREMQPPD